MKLELLVAVVAVAAATIACAAQHEEAVPSEVDRAADPAEEQAVAPEASAEPAALQPGGTPTGDGELNLDQIQRELAANEAKLRALGVALPGPAKEQPPSSGDEDGSAVKTPKPSAGGAGGAGAKTKGSEKKQSKRERERRTLEPDRATEKDGAPKDQPDQAKAAPRSPDADPPEQDAAGRCLMICDLSQVTCELNAQICELADRHDDDDYRSACERAAEDCEVAQEACNACVG